MSGPAEEHRTCARGEVTGTGVLGAWGEGERGEESRAACGSLPTLRSDLSLLHVIAHVIAHVTRTATSSTAPVALAQRSPTKQHASSILLNCTARGSAVQAALAALLFSLSLLYCPLLSCALPRTVALYCAGLRARSRRRTLLCTARSACPASLAPPSAPPRPALRPPPT